MRIGFLPLLPKCLISLDDVFPKLCPINSSVSPCDLFTGLVLRATGLCFEKHISPRPVLCPDVLQVHLRASCSWTLAWPSLPTLRFHTHTNKFTQLATHTSDALTWLYSLYKNHIYLTFTEYWFSLFPNLKPVNLCHIPLYMQ